MLHRLLILRLSQACQSTQLLNLNKWLELIGIRSGQLLLLSFVYVKVANACTQIWNAN